eukprot:Gb_39912 [translate_table: standard]
MAGADQWQNSIFISCNCELVGRDSLKGAGWSRANRTSPEPEAAFPSMPEENLRPFSQVMQGVEHTLEELSQRMHGRDTPPWRNTRREGRGPRDSTYIHIKGDCKKAMHDKMSRQHAKYQQQLQSEAQVGPQIQPKKSNEKFCNLDEEVGRPSDLKGSPIGMNDDTVSSNVVDSKKDDPKGVSRDDQNVLTVGTMAIDTRGVNYHSPCVLTVNTMAIDTRVCYPKILTVGTMPIDTDVVDSNIPGLLKVTDHYSSRGSIVVSLDTKLLLEEQLHFLVREFKAISSKLKQCQAKFMLQNVVFGIFDDRGNIDADINGRHHALIIDLNPKNAIQHTGPVPIYALPKIAIEPPQTDGGKVLLSKEFLKKFFDWYSIFPKGKDSQSQSFSSRYLNVVDLIPKPSFELLGPLDQDLDGGMDLTGFGIKVKQHEDNLKIMENHKKVLDDFLLEMKDLREVGKAIQIGNEDKERGSRSGKKLPSEPALKLKNGSS